MFPVCRVSEWSALFALPCVTVCCWFDSIPCFFSQVEIYSPTWINPSQRRITLITGRNCWKKSSETNTMRVSVLLQLAPVEILKSHTPFYLGHCVQRKSTGLLSILSNVYFLSTLQVSSQVIVFVWIQFEYNFLLNYSSHIQKLMSFSFLFS